MAGYFGLPPGMRAPVAGTSLPACGLIHSIQSGHQLPWVSLAFSMNSSSDAAFPSNVQYWYFPDDGGLTTPAIWPDPASRKRIGAFIASVIFQTERAGAIRSEEHTSELQSLMRISYAVFCLKKKKRKKIHNS